MKQSVVGTLLLLGLWSCNDTPPILTSTVLKQYSTLADECARKVHEAAPVGNLASQFWTENYSELASAVTTTLRDTGAYLLDDHGAQLEIVREGDYYHVTLTNATYAYSETFPTLAASKPGSSRSGMSSSLSGYYQTLALGPAAVVILDKTHIEGKCSTNEGEIEYRPYNRMSGRYHDTALPEIDFDRETACLGSTCDEIGSSYRELKEETFYSLQQSVRYGALFPVNFRLLVQHSEDF